MSKIIPIREQVLEHIRTVVLERINGTDPYSLTLIKATRNLRQPTEFEKRELPAIMIRDDLTTPYQPLTAQEYSTGDQTDIRDGMQIGFIGINKLGLDLTTSKATGKISKAANQLDAEMKLAILTDTRLNGLCEAICLVSSYNPLDWVENDNLVVVVQIYSVQYIFNPTEGIA